MYLNVATPQFERTSQHDAPAQLGRPRERFVRHAHAFARVAVAQFYGSRALRRGAARERGHRDGDGLVGCKRATQAKMRDAHWGD
jgi:hypothetical protein